MVSVTVEMDPPFVQFISDNSFFLVTPTYHHILLLFLGSYRI
jgi:hypothetical protein